MKMMLRKYIDQLRSSYWFLPLVMALASVGLSVGMVALDRHVGTDWLRSHIPWLYVNQPDGARAVLQTIAGSMITVAGVTFSITIATLANAANQFGPRLMTNFMNDRGNQITLGTFIATFLYSILVLRTVRGNSTELIEDLFVPNLAILFSVGLALASLAVLIYFIHHIPESIHISNMIARAGRQLNDRIAALYPARLGHGANAASTQRDEEAAAMEMFEGMSPVFSRAVGYVQRLETAQLARAATKGDCLLSVVARPGAFVGPDVPLVLVKPADLATGTLGERIQDAFVIGALRTPTQDVIFLVDQLVEVAMRALSPGVNDPFTALYCMDWLASALMKLAGREIPSAYRYDDAGVLRVVAMPVTFEDLAEAVFAQLRPYVQTDRNAAVHMAEMMVRIARTLQTDEQRAILRHHAAALAEGCQGSLSDVMDRDAVNARIDGVYDALAWTNPPSRLVPLRP